ncbi:hypothetical protein AZI86_11795 [Bdellovibrio bacteriovorus]|uniref:Uncharacterized protein n=2 Tax=Bdellovibrio bacteriovorus TaxID=959 RepID=A0A150WMR1_BDEBC|nr:hypothetical protein AZI86_11795 [Bdellovibrio bacteriovorus]
MPARTSADLKKFLNDLNTATKVPTTSDLAPLVLPEYPFDHQLLSASSVYERSRRLYNSLGGIFQPRLCSTMRSLSHQDLFKDQIDFTPSATEFYWFRDHAAKIYDPDAHMKSMQLFNEISLYHEQNHRIVWRVLPPAPQEERDLQRYLNFAESLVVTMDLALGDALGKDLSNTFERLRLIYRPGGEDVWAKKSSEVYRQYLLAVLCATYMLLERVFAKDILKALNYIFPDQKVMNKDATQRALGLSELFTENTNPQWQKLNWKSAQEKLEEMHIESEEEALYLPEDPLDLEEEFIFAHRLFDLFEI